MMNKYLLEAIVGAEIERAIDDTSPPSYLPMREQPPARIPDLCPDDTGYTDPHSSRAREEFENEAAKDAIENAHLIDADGNDDGTDLEF